jgi:RNA binding exosome subunit
MDLSQATGTDGNPITVLTGRLPDQAALRGILTRLWDLNLTLISVTRKSLF